MVEVHEKQAAPIAAAMQPDGDLVAVRLARGCRCFAVWIDGALGGYGWLSSGPEWIGEIQLEIKPRAGEGYIWNCVTLGEHRRKGVFRSILVGVSEIVRREGMRRLWVGSVAIPAERAVRPSGFVPALRFNVLRLAGVHVMSVAPASEGALVEDALSVLAVRPGLHMRRLSKRRH